MNAVVIGQIALDVVLQVDEHPGDEQQSVPVRQRHEMLGGKGANQAVALAQLGVPAALISTVGGDPTGRALLALATAAGVNVSRVVQRDEVSSAMVVDVVDAHARRRHLEYAPEELALGPRDVFAASELLRDADAVIVQLREPPAAALQAARLARGGSTRVVLDGAPAGQVNELLADADVVRANAAEAEALAGHPIRTAEEALDVGTMLLDAGPSLAVLEVEGEGNAFISPGGHEFLPLLDTEVVDPTGAGDALVATLTAALLSRSHVRIAARLAVAAAAATAEHPGGRPALDPRRLRREARAMLGAASSPR